MAAPGSQSAGGGKHLSTLVRSHHPPAHSHVSRRSPPIGNLREQRTPVRLRSTPFRFQLTLSETNSPPAWHPGPPLTGIPSDHAVAAAWADLDEDGRPDLWLVGRDGLWIAIRMPRANWILHVALGKSGTAHPDCLAIADIDQDGDLDVWLPVQEPVSTRSVSHAILRRRWLPLLPPAQRCPRGVLGRHPFRPGSTQNASAALIPPRRSTSTETLIWTW